jgi:two-component system response regulator MprA
MNIEHDRLVQDDRHDFDLLTMAMPLVLVAEDDPEMSRTIERMLSMNGYRVVAVNDSTGLMAYLDAAARHPKWVTWPDIIIADIRASKAGAFRALEWLRERDWSTPVIIISARADGSLRDEAGRLGATVVAKPFDMLDLRERVLVAAPPYAGA